MPDTKSVSKLKDLNDLHSNGEDIGALLEKAKKKAQGQLILEKNDKANFFDDYVDFASSMTDAPVEFHRLISYAIAGILYGRQIYLPWGSNNIYPNFYLVTIAPSSIFRKSTALSIGAKILKAGQAKIFPSEFSLEKLIDILAVSAQGTFIHYEFKTLLGLLSRDYMQGAKAFLTEIYDSPDEYDRETKSTTVSVKNPCVSILAATTMEWFLQTMKQGDISGGFLTRFLFVPATKKDKSMPIPPKLDREKQEMTTNWIGKMREIKGEMMFSKEADVIWCEWYYKQEKRIMEEKESSFAVRLQTYASKFAMLNAAVIDHSNVISGKNMEQALELADWVSKHTNRIIRHEMSGSIVGKLIIKIKKAITNGKINNRELLRKADVSGRQYNEAITTMEERGDIEISYEKHEKGRPTKWIHLLDEE